MKKRTILWVVLSLFVTMLVQGCTNTDDSHATTIQEGQVESSVGEGSDNIDSDNAAEAGTDGDKGASEANTDMQIQPPGGVSDVYYAYQKLDEKQQETYLEMLDALTMMETDASLSVKDKSGLDLIFTCVMNDHPELFYVEGYKLTEYTRGGKTLNIAFSGTYSMTADEVLEKKAQLEQRVAECFREVPLNEDEYSTVLFFYDWVINNTDYDKTAENNQNICSVFLQGKSVCQGYAKSTQYLLQKAGIQCLIVTGFTNGEHHAWNLVLVNGNYYYLDPTWGDASYSAKNENDDLGGFEPPVNYDYFLVTTDEITRTHSIEKAVELPLCLAMDDNYFVREGLYFEGYDKDKIAAAFGSEKVKSDGYITIKCNGSESYNVMIDELIGAQRVFDFVEKKWEGVAYSVNDKQRTISFWNMQGVGGS